MAIILSIDQGTTSSRAVLYDSATFDVIGTAQQEIPQYYPQDGWVEHEPEEIWYSVAATVRQALRNAGKAGTDIAAIGITNQRETVVVWDRSGRPVGRAIVWQDRRTAEFCKAHKGEEAWLTSKTGLVLDPYFSGTKLRWLLNSDPEIRSSANAGKLAAGTIDSFLIWRLTGSKVHATDVTNASRTLLFHIHTLRWDDDLLKYFDVPMGMLPSVHPSAADFGVTHGLDFLPDGIPIRGVAGDQQAALFGQGGFNAGQGKCTYGTGAFYLLHTGDKPVSSRAKLLTTVAAMIDEQPRYALEGAVFVAGAAVQWLRDGLHLIKSSSEIERMVAEAPAGDPIIFVPAFVGLGAPHWNPEARGAIFGLTRATRDTDIARAALEGVAFQVADLMDAAASDLPELQANTTLRVDGGMSRNDWFLQCQADFIGGSIFRAKQSESTALGAAFLAAIGAKIVSGESSLQSLLSDTTRFEAKMNADERNAKRLRWKKAVEATIRFGECGS